MGEVLADLPLVGDVDLGVVCGCGSLLGGEDLLEKFFPRAKTSINYVDVLVGLVAREVDQVLGQFADQHGLAHVEDKDRSVVRQGCCLEHKLGGLGDGHEVALHVGVGYGDGPSIGYLLLEDRDDAATGAQDVAEADRYEGLVLAGPGGALADDHLGDAF